jgi:RNA polymerase sigma-70 factor (sigma-E family)
MRDEAEFTDFVHATGNQLFRTALLLCGDHHLAEDLTQTTYAKVYASWRKVQRADNPVAYARTMLTNTFLSHRRLRRTSERPIAELPENQYHDDDPSFRVDLLRALASLPPKDRAVLVLRFWEDRSVEQTAHALGLSSGAVRTRSSRALARLRDCLEPSLLPSTSSVRKGTAP